MFLFSEISHANRFEDLVDAMPNLGEKQKSDLIKKGEDAKFQRTFIMGVDSLLSNLVLSKGKPSLGLWVLKARLIDPDLSVSLDWKVVTEVSRYYLKKAIETGTHSLCNKKTEVESCEKNYHYLNDEWLSSPLDAASVENLPKKITIRVNSLRNNILLAYFMRATENRFANNRGEESYYADIHFDGTKLPSRKAHDLYFRKPTQFSDGELAQFVDWVTVNFSDQHLSGAPRKKEEDPKKAVKHLIKSYNKDEPEFQKSNQDRKTANYLKHFFGGPSIVSGEKRKQAECLRGSFKRPKVNVNTATSQRCILL